MSIAPGRRRKRQPLREGDVDAAHTVTFQNINVETTPGNFRTKRIKVALDSRMESVDNDNHGTSYEGKHYSGHPGNSYDASGDFEDPVSNLPPHSKV